MADGNEGAVDLGLLDVRGQTARDDSTEIRFLRGSDGRILQEYRRLAFPPRRVFNKLPAPPQAGVLICQITPLRFRYCHSSFTLTDRKTITQNPKMLRLPDKWNAQFLRWKQLPAGFAPLKAVLARSPDLGVMKGRTLGAFSDAGYDDVDDKPTILAKASMLNLYAKLSGLGEPTGTNRSWFSFITRILEIGRERIIALVDPTMAGIVENVRSNLHRYTEYRKAEDPEGHQKNVPKAFRSRVQRIFSIKSRGKKATIQITVFVTDDPSVVVLDADIDENGEFLPHLADGFKHLFTGGTHPFDIHEHLIRRDHDLQLGYVLV